MCGYKVLLVSLIVLLCPSLYGAEESVDKDYEYMLLAERLCESRMSVFSECLSLSNDQCVNMLFNIFEYCDNAGFDSSSSLSREEQLNICMENKYLLHLDNIGIDADVECEL